MPFAFDDFVFDEAALELRRAGSPVKVDAKVLEVLAYLLHRPGQLVTKDELLERLWGGRALSDNVISVTMAKLRKALGHGAEGVDTARYLVNVYGRGYRFAGPLRQVGSTPSFSENAPAADVAGRAAEAPFVGRGPALSRVLEALARARGGRGQMVAVAGEPGIGKTHLAEVATRRAAELGVRSVWAHGRELEIEPPFGPWARLLRGSARTTASGAARDAVARAVSSLVPRMENPPARERGAAPLGVIDATLAALQALTNDGAWVLVFDDLHWADAASLRLLSGIVPEIAQLPLLVLVTVRNTEAPSGESRADLLGAIVGHRNTERVALHRLTEAEVNEYAAVRLGREDALVGHAVFAKSEGNPFFMVELLRPFAGATPPQGDDFDLSGPALDVVRRRIRRLTSETRETIAVAAVLGRSFDAGLLGSVTGQDGPAVLDALEGARATQAILEIRDRPGHFVFGHDFIRGVLVEDLPQSRRSEIHLRVADALERRSPTGAGVPQSALVHHLLSAVPLGDVRAAVGLALRAARAAANVFAHTDAAALLRRALGALDVSPAPDSLLRSQVLLELARSVRASGDGDFMLPFREAAALARAHGLGEVLARASRYASSMPGAIPMPGALEILEVAEGALTADRKDLRADVLARLAWTPPHGLDAARATALAGRAETLARESGSPGALVSALAAKLHLATGPDSADLGEAIFDEVDRLPGLPPHHRALWAAHAEIVRLVVSLQRGDMVAADRAIAHFGAVARELRNVELQWHHDRARAVRRMNVTGFAGIGDVLQALRRRVTGLGLLGTEAICTVDRGVLLRESMGTDPEVSLEGLIAIDAIDPPAIRARKIRSLAEAGALGRARAALQPMADILEQLPRDRDYVATLAHLAVASVDTGSTAVSERLYALLERYPLLFVADVTLHSDGSASRFLGMLAGTLDRHPRAVAHFEEARVQNARAGLAPHAARSQHDLAMALARTGQAARARTFAVQALEESEKLGMPRLTETSRQLLRELGG